MQTLHIFLLWLITKELDSFYCCSKVNSIKYNKFEIKSKIISKREKPTKKKLWSLVWLWLAMHCGTYATFTPGHILCRTTVDNHFIYSNVNLIDFNFKFSCSAQKKKPEQNPNKQTFKWKIPYKGTLPQLTNSIKEVSWLFNLSNRNHANVSELLRLFEWDKEYSIRLWIQLVCNQPQTWRRNQFIFKCKTAFMHILCQGKWSVCVCLWSFFFSFIRQSRNRRSSPLKKSIKINTFFFGCNWNGFFPRL